jgi:hypothetical protein
MSELPSEAELIEQAKSLGLHLSRSNGRWAPTHKYMLTTDDMDGPVVAHLHLETVANVLRLIDWRLERGPIRVPSPLKTA